MMESILFEVIQIFICILECYLIFDLFKAFLKTHEWVKPIWAQCLVIGISALLIRILNSSNCEWKNLIEMAFIHLFTIVIFFKGPLLKKVFCYLGVFAIVIGSEILTFSGIAHCKSYIGCLEKYDKYRFILLVLGNKLLTFVVSNFVKRVLRKTNEKMDLMGWLMYSIVPLSTMGVIFTLAYMDVEFVPNRFPEILLQISIFLIIVGNMCNFYVLDRYIFYIERVNYQKLIISKLKLEEKRYQDIENLNRQRASFMHDIRKYLKCIATLANENNCDTILEVLSELEIEVEETEQGIYCRNHLLNIILNGKKKEADDKKINLVYKVEPDFSIFNVSDADLIIIMGNILDNALEAAAQCDSGFIKLSLYMQNSGHVSVIKVVNNHCNKINCLGNKIRTSKLQKHEHGFGIENIDSTARKYGGYFHYQYDADYFTGIVVLPNREESN